MFYYEIDELWRLNDSLNIKDAAALIAGYEPIYVEWKGLEAGYFQNENNHAESDGIARVNITLKALLGAIKAESLPAKLRVVDYGPMEEPSTIWEETEIKPDDLKEWLKSKGMTKCFFFPDKEESEVPGYMDPKHFHYSNTLHAAVKAWEAMQDPGQLKGKAIKTAMSDWLRSNYQEFKLAKDDDSINESVIKEIAKIANWNKTGGAPSTPETPVSE